MSLGDLAPRMGTCLRRHPPLHGVTRVTGSCPECMAGSLTVHVVLVYPPSHMSFATLRCLYSVLASPSRKASRSAALSLAMVSRSSAAVLQLRTDRINSLREKNTNAKYENGKKTLSDRDLVGLQT